MSSVPATMRARPAPDFRVSFSLNTKYENATVTTMLSLSMGTTTLARIWPDFGRACARNAPV